VRIAQLAPLEERVPPAKYGGTELIVSLLTEGLVARGHQVTLFAAGDAITKAKLVSVIDHSLRTDSSGQVRRWSAYDLRSLIELEHHIDEFDIVHNHMGYLALPFLKEFHFPNVTTIHNPIEDYCRAIFVDCKELPYVAISNAYKQLNLSDQLNYAATIYNGIDLDLYTFNADTKREYLLFLGRISKDKGTRPAIEIAKALNLPLKIAGKIDPADQDYYNEEVKPLLNDQSIEYIGEVDFDQKLALYSKAIAVVYPIAFPEPFGLVMAEAQAVGTPVMALDLGSVKEIIVDGKTGIVAQTTDELINRFGEIKNISAKACREQAEKFSSKLMITEYEKLYQLICKTKSSAK
jgi:glycosyltransferase involved in cell wall biosynthesis